MARKIAKLSGSSIARVAHQGGLPVGPATRPKKMPDDTVEELVREHQIGEVQTYAEATDRANEMLTDPVSYSTVRRRMHDLEDTQEAEKAHIYQDTSDLPGRKKLPHETVAELVRERAAHEIGSSYKEAHEKVNEILEEPVPYSTVRRRIHEAEDQ